MGAQIKFVKVVTSLPGTLVGNTLYAVRVGTGFDLYLTSDPGLGTVVAKKVNDTALPTPLSDIAGLSPSNDDIIQLKSGVWVNRSMAQLKTDLGYTINGLLPSQSGHSGEFLTTNGSAASWAAAGGGGPKIYPYVSSAINAKNTGNTILFTTEAGLGVFVITGIDFYAPALVSKSSSGGFSFGWTASSYNDYKSGISFSNVTQQGKYVNYYSANLSGFEQLVVPANTAFRINITSGVSATTFNVNIIVTGYYVN